jgi:mRNA interferase RelE/StbE
LSGPYEIAWSATAKRDLTRLPEKVAAAVVELVYGALADNPRRVGAALRLGLEGLHSARRGDYRVIYAINVGAHHVSIVTIEHRSDAYRRRQT